MDQINQVEQYAHARMADDETGHGYDHVLRVVKMARTLLQSEPTASELVTISAAYLHDVIDDKLVHDMDRARTELNRFLRDSAFTEAQIEEIFFIIDNMSYSKTLTEGGAKPLPIEGQIVQDADRLDAIGAIGVTRAIYFGGHYGEKIYDPEIPARTNMSKEEYRSYDHETIINHFSEKLFKLAALMNTDEAKRIAAGRNVFMHDFLDQFMAEWDAEK